MTLHPSDIPSLLGHTNGSTHLALIAEGGCRSTRYVRAAGDGSELRAVVDELLAANAATAGSMVLLGVNPRCRPGSRDEHAPLATAMVLDFDAQKVRDEALLKKVLERAPLTALVASGTKDNGHLYWTFEAPVPAQEAANLMRRLHRAVGGDASWSPAKMMRLPGSLNWKSGTGVPLRVVEASPNVRTTLAAFERALDEAGVPPLQLATSAHGAARGSPSKHRDGLAASPLNMVARLQELYARLAPWTLTLIRYGKQDGDRYPSRSEADFAVVSRLLEAGAASWDIFAVFEAHPAGIGVRHRQGERNYLERTIENARQQLDVATAKVLAISGTPDRVVLDLQLVDGENEGLRFPTGVSVNSTAWRWVFKAAGLPMPNTFGELDQLRGRLVGVKLGHSALGLVEVRRWVRPPTR